MKTRHIHTREARLILGAAILATAIVTLIKVGSGGGECPFQGAAWFVLQILQPVIAAGLRSVPAYLYDGTGLLQHLPHIVESVGPLFCLVAG